MIIPKLIQKYSHSDWTNDKNKNDLREKCNNNNNKTAAY